MSTRHQWTADELAYLRAHYPTTRTADLVQALGIDARKIYSKAVELGVRKTTETIARMARERSSAPGHGGQRTQFRPGQRPWNKGTHFAPPGSRATQFKPGQVNGRAAKLVQPIGTLRINYDGYLDRKVSDLPGPPHRRWHPVHRLVWEAAHGPVPKGHVVVFLPGKFTAIEHEITLDRVELITRRELMRRNSVHTVQPPELARITQLRGALVRQINRRSRLNEQ